MYQSDVSEFHNEVSSLVTEHENVSASYVAVDLASFILSCTQTAQRLGIEHVRRRRLAGRVPTTAGKLK